MSTEPSPRSDAPAGASAHRVRRARLWSVGGKLAGATIVLVILVTVGIYLKLSRYQRENLLQSKEAGAAALARLFADSCAAAVVFDDAAALKESVAAFGHNQEVEYAAVWAVEGAKELGSARIGRLLAELRRGRPESVTEVPSAMRLRRDADRVVQVAPVHNIDGRIVAVAVTAFSLAREDRVIADIEKKTLLVSSGVAIGLTVLLMAMARLVIVGPLGKLVLAAKQLEEGGSGEVDVNSNDEVGKLAHAFRSMAAAINIREERINARNRDMRFVLDNVGQGFITLDVEGGMSEERSRVVDVWFGTPDRSLKFWDYLGLTDSTAGQWFEVGWMALQDGVLPLSLCLEQLPKLARKEERTFELTYRPIMKDDRLDKIIVVITDVTARVEREESERRQREMMSIFRRLLSDRAAFEEFFDEATRLVDAIVAGDSQDPSLLKRQVHTLKGNAALFGMESVSEHCHGLEDRLNGSGEPVSAADRAQLRAIWTDIEQMRADLIDHGAEQNIAIDRADYAAVLDDLRRHADHDSLLATVAAWEHEPASKRLALIGEQIQRLAARLGKVPVDVLRQPTNLRLPPRKWGPVWSALAHVVRNTVDHGVEKPAERAKAGKSPRATVVLSATLEGPQVVVSIQDDGRGIDWAKIAERARVHGLPCETRSDLEDALFAEGISSSSEVSSTSGRGVGLAAVRAVVQELGGHVEIQTEPGRGTTFRCALPRSMLIDERPADDGSVPAFVSPGWSRPQRSEKA